MGTALFLFCALGGAPHTHNAVGVAAQSYRVGLAGIWYQWIMIFTLPIYWLLAPVFRRARVLTTADFFDRRFGPQVMVLYSVFALFVTISFTGVMLYGSARLVEALTGGAISWQLSVLLMACVSFFYGIAGGLVAAVWNDFFQGILTVVMSLLIIPFFWVRIGGPAGFRAHLPDPVQTFRLVLSQDMTIYWILMMSINSLVSMVAQPHIMANTAAARTEMDSRIGFVGGMILKRIMTVPWALTGVMAIAMYGSGAVTPDHVFGAISRDLLPAGFVGLMLACVMASVMDNCAVNMLSFAGIYTNSIHRRLLVRSAPGDERFLRVDRIAAICFSVVSIALSYLFSDVPAAMRFLWQTVPIMGIPFFLGLLWRRTNRFGAMASFVAALSAVLIAKYVLHWEGDAGLPGTIALFLGSGTLAGIVVSLLTPPETQARLDCFYLLLKTPIGQEQRLVEAGFTEIPGTGTYEPPPEGQLAPAARGPWSANDAIHKKMRWQTACGVAAMTCIAAAMLVGVRLMAAWLGG